LANGAAAHAVELDDDHRTSVLHPGVVVVPAALAMAEKCNASGRTFLEGVIVGYEIMTRIGDAFLGRQYYEGFHSTGTCGVFGAAAACSRVMGLDATQTTTALGIAGTQAAGLGEWANDGSWIKRLHPGKSAEAGILAALLASRGFTAPNTIIEGQQGFLKAFSYERIWNMDKILDGLGAEFRGSFTSIKPYAGCRFSHQVIDAVLEIVEKHEVKVADIDDVSVRIHTTSYRKLFVPAETRYRPLTPVDAQFSIPYIVAIALLHGRPMPQHFSEEMIRSPEVIAFAARVRGEPDDEYEKQYPLRYPTHVTIRLRNGAELSAYCDLPSGDPENEIYLNDAGLFERHVLAKVDVLLEAIPAFAGRRDEIVATIRDLDSAPDLKALLRLVTA
jgi:2-methylcitrate dehydratase PrpD